MCVLYTYRLGFKPLSSKDLRTSLLYVKLLGLLASTGVSLDARDRKPVESFTDDANPANK